jgi:hypothetical protein
MGKIITVCVDGSSRQKVEGSLPLRVEFAGKPNDSNVFIDT